MFILDNETVLVDPMHIAKKGIPPLRDHSCGYKFIRGYVNRNEFVLRSVFVGVEKENRPVICDAIRTNGN